MRIGIYNRVRTGALGFSLLEVMVAIALLAMSFTMLILVQGRATKLASESRNISIATQLARMQLLECQREVKKDIASASDISLEGDFSEQGFPKFKWECHAPRFNMKTPSASDLEQGLKKNSPESAKKDVGATSTVSAPFIAMITDALGDSVRELMVIVRWMETTVEDELRVVTHVIDPTPMTALSRMLAQGAKAMSSSKDKNKDQEKKAGDAKERPRAPGGPRFRQEVR